MSDKLWNKLLHSYYTTNSYPRTRYTFLFSFIPSLGSWVNEEKIKNKIMSLNDGLFVFLPISDELDLKGHAIIRPVLIIYDSEL